MPRKAQKPKNGNRSEEAQNHGGGDIALQRKALQEWGTIGNNDPGGENQGQTNTNVDTDANRRVAEDMEPALPRQMRTDQHEVLGSQDASNRLTRIDRAGRATSTTTRVPGAPSFPAR